MSDGYSAVRGDTPDISQLTPATGRAGAPASGTYGEKAALAELEAALPAPTPGAERQQGVTPAASGGPLPLAPPSGALPRSIMAPSNRPFEPLSTPLTQPVPVASEPSGLVRQQIEAWARDPNLHALREWAQSVLAALEPR